MRELSPVGNQRLERGGALSTVVFILGILAFLSLLYLARHPLFRVAGGMWVVEDRLAPADAIIVLSDDNFYGDRATRAAELYRQELAPLVVASGRRLRSYAGIAELMEHDLYERGVPKARILAAPHRADNTREEAQVMLELAKQRKWHRVIVVTSSYHARRARYIYRHVFPETLAVYVASAPDGDFDPQHWWEKRVSVKLLAREIVGMLVAVWELGGKSGSRRDESRTEAWGDMGKGHFVAVLGPGQPVGFCRKGVAIGGVKEAAFPSSVCSLQ